MNKRLFLICLTVWLWSPVFADGPYAPAAGQPGSTAVHMGDPNFVGWATGIEITRGEVNISEPNGVYASHGPPSNALGPAKGDIFDVVSLGDGGVAVLTFEFPIANGPGWDFAVFENGFVVSPPNVMFLELAFVEVSGDGIHFERFPAVSLVPANDPDDQLSTGSPMNTTLIQNFAGKYQREYGTPFDLEELKGVNPLVDVSRITHVRIIDVVGCIADEWATYDSLGNKVNDPWPTPFPTGGFDLDAVGVRHQKTLRMDFDGNGIVNLLDFAAVASVYVNDDFGFEELKDLVEEWLQVETWYLSQ